EALEQYPNVRNWLDYVDLGGVDLEGADVQEREAEPTAEFLLKLAEHNVVAQLKNLRTHPWVASRLNDGDLTLLGWVYHIGPGKVTAWDEQSREFREVG
ncbi:MAG TPA: carbonic anhydrase, partial [Silvibacterium sp.]|nr:carbonic anhydrase [Silvibacterium sp.]